jgi:hypothetical protein
LGWIERTFETRRLRALVREVTRLKGEALSAELERAIVDTGRGLKPKALGPRLRSSYPQLLLIFARQRADANARLASRHWSSGVARNVGMDVLEAQALAQGLLVSVLARRPAHRRPLSALAGALESMIVARRSAAGDPDGYGVGTLREIQRDIAQLALAESAARN